MIDFETLGTYAGLAAETSFWIVDLEDLKIPLDPLILINADSKVATEVDQPLTDAFATTNESFASEVK